MPLIRRRCVSSCQAPSFSLHVLVYYVIDLCVELFLSPGLVYVYSSVEYINHGPKKKKKKFQHKNFVFVNRTGKLEYTCFI